jgi:hypothetical protein
MSAEAVRKEVAAVLKRLGLVQLPDDWRGCGAVWEVLELMATEGAVVVIKIDGERTGSEDNGKYTVIVTGSPLKGEPFRLDTSDLEVGLGKAILHYAQKCWA